MNFRRPDHATEEEHHSEPR